MVSFDNTEVAFRAQNNRSLNRTYRLFRLIGNPVLVKAGQILTDLSITLNLPITRIIKPTVFNYFCGGETIEECDQKVSDLAKYNIGSVLDYSIEGKATEKDFEKCATHVTATLHRAKNDSRLPFCVFKVTGLARIVLLEKISSGAELTESEKKEFEKAKDRVNSICRVAHENNVPVFIDAEESWIQEAIDRLANAMMKRWNTEKPLVYNTFQLYRKDRLDYLKKSFELARSEKFFLGAKLVRGAYMEKERARAAEKGYLSPIQETKQDTDRDFDQALEFCVHNLDRVSVCSGTHNEQSSLFLVKLMKENKIEPGDKRIWFSQLLGMSDHISYNLSAAGYNVAKYVPFGPVKEVIPYLIRRAQENTSVKGQAGRELSLILKEKNRRKGLNR